MNQSPIKIFDNNSLPFYNLSFSIVFKSMIAFNWMNKHAKHSLPLLDLSLGICVIPGLGRVWAQNIKPKEMTAFELVTCLSTFLPCLSQTCGHPTADTLPDGFPCRKSSFKDV